MFFNILIGVFELDAVGNVLLLRSVDAVILVSVVTVILVENKHVLLYSTEQSLENVVLFEDQLRKELLVFNHGQE